MKKLVSNVVGNPIGWKLVNGTIVRVADYAKLERYFFENRRNEAIIQRAIEEVVPDLVVRHVPFQGLRYLESKAFGSLLFPKLIGSYETELQAVIEKAIERNYTEVVDVGCAEGYYAVGLAKRLPTPRVYAFDTNEAGLLACVRMAQLNGISDRLTTGSFCSSQTLQQLPYRERALILSDCEGGDEP